jgi:hypothetical protein
MWQPRIGLLAVDLGGLGQTVNLGTGSCAFGYVAEQPSLATDYQFPTILPISGKTWKSIIPGIRYMDVVSGFETASNAVQVGSTMLRKAPA